MSARLISALQARAKKAEVSPKVKIYAWPDTFEGVIIGLDASNGFVELLQDTQGRTTLVVLDKISAVTPEFVG
jgi:hypothetical protein